MHVLAALLTATILSLLLTPAILKLSVRFGFLKKPGDRHVHTQPIPHLGGIALVLAVLPVAIFFLGFSQGLLGFYSGAVVIAIIGVWDDLKDLSPKTKLLGQIVAALLFSVIGGGVSFLSNPFGAMLNLGWLGVPLAVFWIVAVINTVNLIDGLDGLAAGTVAIAAVAMLLVASHRNEGTVALLAATLIGSTVGFLRYNFEPARIFMGDTGSGFLGYSLAALAITGTVKDATAITLAAPVVALALPIFDTGFAIFRRVKNGRPIGEGDRDHIHHRLLDRGLGQRRTVLLLYGITALFGVVAVLLVDLPIAIGVLLGVVIVTAVLGGAVRWDLFRLKGEPQERTRGVGQ